jgi:hemoglobin
MDRIEEADEQDLARVVARFYAAVRTDALIGAVFNDAIDDWPEHLEKLTAFWSSLMLTSGRYKGAPMAAHLKHRARITPRMFERWLALWREATDAEMPPGVAALMQIKAERIAQNFKFALKLEPESAASEGDVSWQPA